MSQTVGIVIPAYQPDPNILSRYIKDLKETTVDLVHLEIDNPSEHTLEKVDNYDSLNISESRRGKGRAISEGFDTLSTDILVFSDADGATPATSVIDVIGPIERGETDIAIGSRRHPESIVKTHQTFYRRRMGDAFAWVARRILPTSVYDYQCGTKALSADAWKSIRPQIQESGFAWDLEVIAVAGAQNLSIEEVPVEWNDASDSTVNPISTPVNLARALLTVRFRIDSLNGCSSRHKSSKTGNSERDINKNES